MSAFLHRLPEKIKKSTWKLATYFHTSSTLMNYDSRQNRVVVNWASHRTSHWTKKCFRLCTLLFTTLKYKLWAVILSIWCKTSFCKMTPFKLNRPTGYCMDRASFCNISVIQQDTHYLMINFIRNIQYLNMFRTSIFHLQERSYAVCCNLVCLDTSCCYEGEGRTRHS